MRALEALGYTYRGGEWLPPGSGYGAPLPFTFEADAMHGALCAAPMPSPAAPKAPMRRSAQGDRQCDRGLRGVAVAARKKVPESVPVFGDVSCLYLTRSRQGPCREQALNIFDLSRFSVVLPVWIEHTTSPLPRECSTTELRQQALPV